MQILNSKKVKTVSVTSNLKNDFILKFLKIYFILNKNITDLIVLQTFWTY